MKCEYCGRPARTGEIRCEGCYAPLPEPGPAFDGVIVVPGVTEAEMERARETWYYCVGELGRRFFPRFQEIALW